VSFKPDAIVIHCSASPDRELLDWHAIDRWHRERGFRCIGYHEVWERQGGALVAVAGRPLTEQGAHCLAGGMNRRAIGICAVGNFDRDGPPEDLWQFALVRVRMYQRVLGIERARVFGHREFEESKTCPGSLWDLERFRKEL
jgi:N-acetylmuramoyl-L-alanine amidase